VWNEDIPYDNGEKAELYIYLPNEKKANGRGKKERNGGGEKKS